MLPAFPVESRVRTRDEVVKRVVGLELRESSSDGYLMGISQVRIDEHEALLRLGNGEIHQGANELVASKTNGQVVGAEMSSQCVDHVTQNLIPGGMAECVIRYLEAIYVDEGKYERLVRPLRPRYVSLQL